MDTFKTNLANLIKVKTLITLTVVAALTYGFIAGIIDAEKFMTIAVMVVTYYFSKKDDVDTTTSKTETVTTTGVAPAEQATAK